jgi:AcrR family transcriptional regulator
VTVVDGTRREEILQTAADLFATSGIRASMREIADACGILPGSLYHHFDSKEAIVIELVTRYQSELDEIAEAAVERPTATDATALGPISELGTAIAECAVRNRAALLLTFYEPPTGTGADLTDLAGHTPDRALDAMHELLRRADARRSLRDDVDLRVLADRLCQSMFHVGIGVYHRRRGAQRVPALKCQMLLEGLAPGCPADRVLDRSPARRAADEVIAAWEHEDHTADRAAFIRSIARAEFGKRGYEATTIRDVAAAAGVRPGNLYRFVESKEQLLGMVLGGYVDAVTTGWNAVVRSGGTALEKLDALIWLDINALDQFSEEHRIQSVSMQYAPPTSPNLGLSFTSQLRQLRKVLADADRAGDLAVDAPSAEMRARCTFSLIWTPDNIISDLGVQRALSFDRATLLRGAAVRR